MGRSLLRGSNPSEAAIYIFDPFDSAVFAQDKFCYFRLPICVTADGTNRNVVAIFSCSQRRAGMRIHLQVKARMKTHSRAIEIL